MTNTDNYRIAALEKQLENQRKEYERQIAQLKAQNEYLKKQLDTQRDRNTMQIRANRAMSLSNSHLRGEVMRVR